MSLMELKASVDADASLHLPDLYYDSSSDDHQVKFSTLLLSSLIDDAEPDVAGLSITLDRQDPTKILTSSYMFTRWSRSQLLSLFGARERWFSFVDLEQQVSEFNARLHAFRSYRIRTMRAVDEDFPVRIVRGLVSSEYSEIKNTDIMSAIIDKADPNSMALRVCSGITDRAFYAYVLSPTPITIPGTGFLAYPGAIVKNSEVGYTSLWVVPALVLKGRGAPAIIESKHVLKRIHRGKAKLPELFEKAFSAVSATWSDLSTKIPHLVNKTFGTEDAAVEKMRQLLESAGSSKELMMRSATAYRSVPRGHTGLDIFEAITEACSTYTDRDELYDVGAIAGSVLYKLTF